MYEFFVSLWERLPDRVLVERIEKGDFAGVLSGFGGLKEKGFRAGLNAISAYGATIRERVVEDVLEELSVDRTRIRNGTGHADLKPPYEGLYKRKRGGDSVLEVRRFYRKAGLIPDEAIPEPADYLTVELDFMRQLCFREEALWRNGGDVRRVIALEGEFLSKHLGVWVDSFCKAVIEHGSTGFFRGIALLLDAFSRVEKKWLQYLAREQG